MKNTCTEIKKLKGEWKVLFNASYKFAIENGVDHETAEVVALESIRKKMKLAKKVRSTEYGH